MPEREFVERKRNNTKKGAAIHKNRRPDLSRIVSTG
jgi:hypothetical protein